MGGGSGSTSRAAANDRIRVRHVEREIGRRRHFEQRGLGLGHVGLYRRRIDGGVELGFERDRLVDLGAVAGSRWRDDRGRETKLGVEHERRVVAKGAVDQALHPRADDAPGDDEVGVGGRDADAGTGADEQTRVALEQDAAVREVDEVDLRSADDARRDRTERTGRMARGGTALLARPTLGDLLVRLHVVTHQFTHVRAGSARPDAPS